MITREFCNTRSLSTSVGKSSYGLINLISSEIFEISTSPKKLFEIKKKLSENQLTKPLFNSKMYVKYLEDGYKQVYHNYLDAKKTKTIFINK